MTVRKPSFPSSSSQNVANALHDLSLDLTPPRSTDEELGRIESFRGKTLSSHDAPSRPAVQSNLSSNNPFRRKNEENEEIALPSSPRDGDESEIRESNPFAQNISSSVTQHPALSTNSRPAHTSAVSIEESASTAANSHQRASSHPPDMPYRIRQVNWADASGTGFTYKLPVMMQNLNGPCPLLALVNAIVLSTPSNNHTPLIRLLSSREEVSIEYLRDAMLEELFERQRIGALPQLPDLDQFQHFLIGLQTGMNANPCFLPSPEPPLNLMDTDSSTPTDLHSHGNAGQFVHNPEMALYSTFGIPLIHGWIPPPGKVLDDSLSRVAPNYDDFQAHLVRKTELREQLDTDGLSPDEATLLEDLFIVEDFLSTTASQLTQDGIKAIQESLTPGATAILFRNNHFSTLYKHPHTKQVYSLITDEGYAEHDEVVWEGFVDVRGQGNGLFSADFRSVSHNTPDMATSQHVRQDQSMGAVHSAAEDYDLAVAMQLQEEEDKRHRDWEQTQSRRRQEDASRRYLDNADARGRRTFPGFGRGAARGHGSRAPQVPPRGGSQTHTPRAIAPRPPFASRRRSSSEDAPPPTYDEAAKGPAYHPPTDSANSPRPRPPPRPRQGSSAWAETTAMQRPAAPKEGKKEKECVVM